MAASPVVALEIGTSKIVALVAERRDDGHILITGVGEYPTSGLRKAEVIDLENAVVCTRSALKAAEESGQVNVRQVHLVVSGGHIQSLSNRGGIPIRTPPREITSDDVDQVMEVARAINLAPDREVLHTLSRAFCVDGQENIAKPEGMEGARLSVDMLVIHGVRGLLRNTVRVVKNVPVDVQDVAFSGLCAALAVLTSEQKESGAVVIDLGGGTTDYFVYLDGVVAAAGCIGVGGDHVTNDIALAFNIPATQAESLKKKSGSAVIDPLAMSKRVKLPAEVGFPGTSVPLKSLHTVMHVRMQELLQLVKARLAEQNLLQRVGAGIVITGGGAYMKGVTDLAEKVFGLPCCIGKPRNVSGLSAVTDRPQYAAVIGMAQYAFMTMTDDAPSLVPPFLKGLFKGRR